MWKDSRNNLKLFQHKKLEKKEAFGKVVNASVVRERNKEKNNKLDDYFKVENEYGDENLLDLSIMNPALMGSNSFCKKVVAYRCTEGGNVKIAAYISRLSRSKDFSNHDPNVFSPVGLKLDASSDSELIEFSEFLAAAKEHATVVTTGREEAVQTIAVKTNRKRKVNNKENTKPLTKQERMEKFFQKELKDPKGVENLHVEYLQGRTDVHIDRLEVCPKVVLPLDDLKVKMLAKDMLERFDPSLISLTVVPSDPDSFDVDNLEENDFQIVHGRHRYGFFD